MTFLPHLPCETLALWMPGNMELLIILAIGLLLFGRRLPEVGRSLGKSIVEFKKGIKGIEDEIETSSNGGQKSQGSLPSNESRTVSRSEQIDAEPAGGGVGGETPSHKPA